MSKIAKQQKIENFNEKIKELKIYINWLRKQAFDEYQNEIKQEVLEQQENNEKQKQVLKFLT